LKEFCANKNTVQGQESKLFNEYIMEYDFGCYL